MKNKTLIFAAIVAFFTLAATASAMTTVSLSPVSANIEEGQTFNLAVSVNSQVVKSYMVKLEIKFPADILEIQSFNFGNIWVPLSQPGYDLTDNTNGILIKSAGYPGGLISQADFGTIVFKAKKNGAGAIQITGNSLAFNVESLNVISGLPIGIPITITQVISPTPETPTQPKTTVEPITEEKSEQPAAQTATQNSLAAAIGGFLTLGTGSVWLGILVGLIILAIIAYAIYSLRKRIMSYLQGFKK